MHKRKFLIKVLLLNKLIAVALAGEAVGAQGLLSRATGTVLNPNLELLFQGPQLRPFTFQFRLSPRGIEELKM